MNMDKSWDGPERRRHRRYPVANLRGVLDGRHAFELLILSEGGMLVRMAEDVQLGKAVDFVLILPREEARGRARVVFSTGEPGPGGTRARRVGLEYLKLDGESRRALSQHIAGELQ